MSCPIEKEPKDKHEARIRSFLKWYIRDVDSGDTVPEATWNDIHFLLCIIDDLRGAPDANK